MKFQRNNVAVRRGTSICVSQKEVHRKCEELRPDMWKGLPDDVIDQIPNHIIPSIFKTLEEYERSVSRLCLVRRTWLHYLRPFLFDYQHISSSYDLQFLYEMLQSPLSARLSKHMDTIKFEEDAFSEALAKQFSLIFPSLINLKTIIYTLTDDPVWQPRSGNSGGLRRFPAMSAPAFLKLPHLTTLGLNNQKFSSFSSLVRLLKHIPLLESLKLYRVFWDCPPIQDLPKMTCKIRRGDFPRFRHITAYACPQHWQLITLLTAFCTPVDTTSSPFPGSRPSVIETIANIVMPGCHNSKQCNGHDISYDRDDIQSTSPIKVIVSNSPNPAPPQGANKLAFCALDLYLTITMENGQPHVSDIDIYAPEKTEDILKLAWDELQFVAPDDRSYSGPVNVNILLVRQPDRLLSALRSKFPAHWELTVER